MWAGSGQLKYGVHVLLEISGGGTSFIPNVNGIHICNGIAHLKRKKHKSCTQKANNVTPWSIYWVKKK